MGGNTLCDLVGNHQLVIGLSGRSIRRIATHQCPINTGGKGINIRSRAHFAVIVVLLNGGVALVQIKFQIRLHRIALGDTKALETHFTVRAQQQIVRRNGTMDHAPVMECLQGGEHRHKHNARLLPRNVALRGAQQKFPQGHAVHRLRHGIHRLVGREHIIHRQCRSQGAQLHHGLPQSGKRPLIAVKILTKTLPHMHLPVALQPIGNALGQELAHHTRRLQGTIIGGIHRSVALPSLHMAQHIPILKHRAQGQKAGVVLLIVIKPAAGANAACGQGRKTIHTQSICIFQKRSLQIKTLYYSSFIIAAG